MSTLFRAEAIEGQRQAWLGEVRLVRPLSLTLLTAFALGVAALLVAFLFTGEITREAQLDGALAIPRAAAGPAPLHAVLYAPPATVGRLHAGQAVRLHYEAFAGQPGVRPATGRIVDVTRTPVNADCPGCDPAAPVRYRVTVALDAQSLRADGRGHALAEGMPVSADVMLDRRRLVDWIFAPARAAAPGGA